MLQEPLIVCNPANGYPSHYSSYLNAPVAGKSSRTFPPLDLAAITVNQGVSNENGKVIETTRSNVRLSQQKTVGETGTFATAYGQLTLSYPKAVFTAADVQAIVAGLVSFVLQSDIKTALDTTKHSPSSDDFTLVPRLYAGEA